MGPNITPKEFAHLNVILDEVNHAYLALSKSAYTSPYSQGIQYMPEVLRPRSSLISLKVLIVFFARK